MGGVGGGAATDQLGPEGSVLPRGRLHPAQAASGESGSVSLELVLLVPVLMLLAVFVLWAGRGGRAGLTADLAAEEAATAAAVCCDEDTAGERAREVIVEDVLRSRPGLQFLCIGGARPDAPPDSGTGLEFLEERWLDFEVGSGASTGGVGVLGVRFLCETDGAVAPLRGVFPTVTFRGQAAEVVLREPPTPGIGFEKSEFRNSEGDAALVFTVTSTIPAPQILVVTYEIVAAPASTATDGEDYTAPDPLRVEIPQGVESAEIPIALTDDSIYEGDETLQLKLLTVQVRDPVDSSILLDTGIARVDDARTTATGVIEEDDEQPHLCLVPSGATVLSATRADGTQVYDVIEGESLAFAAGLRSRDGTSTTSLSAGAVSVDVVTAVDDAPLSGEEAAQSGDYTAVSQRVTFAAGSVSPSPASVPVATVDDEASPVGEPDETFRLELANPMGAPLCDRSGVVIRIKDDEVVLVTQDVEGQTRVQFPPHRAVEEAAEIELTVRLAAAPSADVVLRYRIEDRPEVPGLPRATGGAACGAGVDYVQSTGTLTFTSTDIEQTFKLQMCEDLVVEFDESLWIAVERVSGEVHVPSGSGGIFTILDDEEPVIEVTPVTGTGTEGGTLEFTVNLTVGGNPADFADEVVVDYSLEQDSPVSARQCDDYRLSGVAEGDCATNLGGSLTFGPGEATAQTVVIDLLADYESEASETFKLSLSDGKSDDAAALVGVEATATIEDDPPPVLSVVDFTGKEEEQASFEVTLSDARSGETVTVDYAVAGHPPNAANPHGTPPADFEMVEQTDLDAGGTPRTLALTAGNLNGTLRLDADNPRAEVTVSLLADTIEEVPETLRLTLTNPTGAELFDRDPTNDADGNGDPADDEPYGVGTVLDAEPPEICALDTSALEGEPITFTVVVINPRDGQDVTVRHRVEQRSAKRRSVDPVTGAVRGDFVQPAAGSLTLDASTHRVSLADAAARATMRDRLPAACVLPDDADAVLMADAVTVQTLTDKIAENPETLVLVLGDPSPAGVGMAKSVGVGTIVNVNPAVVRVNDPRAPEGDPNRPLRFVISLVDDEGNAIDSLSGNVEVRWSTRDGTATAGVDYTAVTSGSYTFTPGGVTARTVSVATIADNVNEDDETVELVLSVDGDDDAAAVLGDPVGTGTIIDAPPPALRITDASGSAGATLTFRVQLGVRNSRGEFELKATSEVVRVRAGTEDHTAVAGEDYTAVSQDLVFAVGETSKDFPVATIRPTSGGDGRERFHVVLSSPQNAVIAREFGIGTIDPVCRTLDESIPVVTLDQGTRGVEGTYSRTRVRFSHPVCGQFRVEQSVEYDGTASSADLWIGTRSYSLNETYTWPDAHQEVSVQLTDDGIDEPDETFTVRFRIAGRSQAWSEATVTIIDNDPPPSLRMEDGAAREGENLSFPVTMRGRSSRPIVVEYRTVSTGSATPGSDYADTAEDRWISTTIPARGTGLVLVLAALRDDDTAEGDETFQVELRIQPGQGDDPPIATIDDGIAVGTILEGERPRLRISDAEATEGDDLEFDVTLSAPAASAMTVSYETVQQPARPDGLGRATSGDDYTASLSGAAVTIGTGESSATISVATLDDDTAETDETFLVNVTGVSGGGGASLADASAVGTILDGSCLVPNEEEVTYTVTGESVSEADAVMEFVVELPIPMCVDWGFTAYLVDPAGNSPGDRRAGAPASPATPHVDYGHRVNHNFSLQRLTTEHRIPVPVIDDTLDEPDENVRLWVQSFGGQYQKFVFADGTIVDNDGEPEVSVRPASAVEGEPLGFSVRLDKPSGLEVCVNYATADRAAGDGAATAGADYRTVSGRVCLTAGELSETVVVRTVEDRLYEGTERFDLELSNPDGATLAADGATAAGSILDDDPRPRVRVFDASADEGDPVRFVLRLDAPSGREATALVRTVDGTATAGADYRPARRFERVSFPTGETDIVFSVASLEDDVVEGDEQFQLRLTSPSHMVIGDGVAAGTIRDVTERHLSVSDAFVREGGTLVFRVGFDEAPSSRDVTVRYRTTAGTATAGDDYAATFESVAGTLRILAGETSAAVRVATVQDRLDEDAERLVLTLRNPAGAVLEDEEAIGVIIDDDPLPALSVDDPEATENGEGDPITFTVSLSEPSGRAVKVNYATADLTAEAGKDYTAASDTLTFDVGDTSKPVRVGLLDDDDPEDVERFQLVLSRPDNATIADSVGVGTIVDDEGLVRILVDGPDPVREAADASAAFTVRLSRAAEAEVTVDYATADVTATAGDDYTALSDTLTFAAGDKSKQVSVTVLDDDDEEETETFELVLSNPSTNAAAGAEHDRTVAAILDDDGLPELSAADASAAEGAAAVFEVGLDKASKRKVTFRYTAVADPTADAAAVPALDFEAVAGDGEIAAGATSTTVRVPLSDDLLDEHDETFWLRVTGPENATVGDGTATGTITDNDPLPEMSIADAGATEGDPIGFTVSLSAASGRTVTVPWATAERSADDEDRASAGTDFTAASATLRLRPGATAATISVATADDEIAEADETFFVNLGEPTNATVDDGTAVGAILDDDGLPRASIAGTDVAEDDSPAVFTVTLSRRSTEPVSLDYYTTDGTATAPADYGTTGGARGTLVIPAGLDTGEISVFIADDSLIEGAETFTITLHNPTNAVVAEGSGTAVGTILDDDITRIAIAGAQASEDDATIDFAVTAAPAPPAAVTVRYSTFDGTATQPGDYTATAGTLTIAAGDTAATVSVPLVDDIYFEDTETFRVRLSNPGTGAEIDRRNDNSIGVILNDDTLPKIVADSYYDFNEDVGAVEIQVTLDKPSDREIRVDYSPGGHGPSRAQDTLPEGTNGCQSPAQVTAGTLVFEPGSVAATIPVTIVDDGVSCHWRYNQPHARTLRLFLENAVNAELYDGSNLTTRRRLSLRVWDATVAPCASISAPDGPEMEGAVQEGAGEAVFTVTLNRAAKTVLNVGVSTTSASPYAFQPQAQATAGSDYTALSTTVAIPAGSRQASVSVALLDDDTVEPIEGFALQIAGGSVATCGLNYGRGFDNAFIIDDDTLPEITVTDADVPEDAGTATFNVTLDRASASDVTFDYATADDTATAGEDYTAATGTLHIEAGATGGTIDVDILDDDVEEADETFTLSLSNASGATVSDDEATATATIRDSDSLPVITIADTVAVEEDGSATVTVTLSEPAPGGPCLYEGVELAPRFCEWYGVPPPEDWVSVAYITVALPPGPQTATPTSSGALLGGDYQPASGTVGFLPGATEASLRISLIQRDRLPEFDEKLLVVLHDPANATLGKSRATVTIEDNDRPLVTVDDLSVAEGAGEAVFTVELHAPGVYDASVRYRTVVHASGDAAATPDEDYAVTTGTLDISAGTESVTVSVPIADDNTDEADETFILELYEPKVLTLEKASAVGTITDDDPGWRIEEDRSVWEYAGTMQFTVIRDHTDTEPVTLNYTVTGVSATGGASCDDDGVDYITPSGSVTLAASATSATITVTVCDDTVAEGRETLLVELTGVPGRKLAATGTIIDNDN